MDDMREMPEPITTEPWTHEGGGRIVRASGELVCEVLSEDDAERIVACVNGMAGIEDPTALVVMLRDLRNAAMNTHALDSSEEWTDLLQQADRVLGRARIARSLP